MITRITVHSMFLCEPLDHLKKGIHNDILYILCFNNIFHLDFQDILWSQELHGMFLCEPVDNLKIELHSDILYILSLNSFFIWVFKIFGDHTITLLHGIFLCEPLDHLKIELHNNILYILCLNNILHLDFQDILWSHESLYMACFYVNL